MLEYLRIRNLALIQDMELEFSSGLNVLTGESGVGKSFILKALNFILGDKMDVNMVRPGKDKAQVESLFNLGDQEYIIRRELTTNNNRSRIYINDALSSQEKVRQLRSNLILHTSQHEQQRLLKPSFHNQILNSLIDPDLLDKKDSLIAKAKEIREEKKRLKDKSDELASKREFLEYQQAEIEKVAPKEGEEEELEERKCQLKNQARAQESMQQSLDLLLGERGLLDNLASLQKELLHLAEIDVNYQTKAQTLEEFYYFLQDLESELRQKPLFQESEQELEKIESRLWKLSQLQRRLKRPLSSILNLQQEIRDNLSFLDECNLTIQQLDKQEKELETELSKVIDQVNLAKEKKAKEFVQDLEGELSHLGFSQKVAAVFRFEEAEILPNISEKKGRLMWQPNPGQPEQPLDQIASGGELSRFLLALIGLLSREKMPTLLFDEVDAGIGGVTLAKVGERIKQLADKQQVILISHWPQLACLADRHFQIRKEFKDNQTFTLCTPLATDEIRQELARMAGGGEQGYIVADQLLDKK